MVEPFLEPRLLCRLGHEKSEETVLVETVQRLQAAEAAVVEAAKAEEVVVQAVQLLQAEDLLDVVEKPLRGSILAMSLQE